MHHGPVWIHEFTNEVCNLFVNTDVQIRIYREFYHCIIYIAKEGCHVRILIRVAEDLDIIYIIN